jgi:hypothetical protein
MTNLTSSTDAEGPDQVRHQIARDLQEQPLVGTDLIVESQPASGDGA